MSKLGLLAGNESVVSALVAALESGNLSHAVLLAGPDGCGRNFAARCLAADWLYPQEGHGRDLVMQDECAEVILVTGEGKSGQIPVARIRQVRSDVFLSSLSAGGRVVIIQDAHMMAAPAYNALLKVLEEPPANVLFILTAQSVGALPATIISRCTRYTLIPLDHALCESMLQKQADGQGDASLPAFLSAVYDGRLGLGLQALQDPQRLEILRDAAAVVQAAAKKQEYPMMVRLSKYEGREEGDRQRRDSLLYDCCAVVDAALRQLDAPGIPKMDPQQAGPLLEPFFQARQALKGNAAAKLTFTAMIAQIGATTIA